MRRATSEIRSAFHQPAPHHCSEIFGNGPTSMRVLQLLHSSPLVSCSVLCFCTLKNHFVSLMCLTTSSAESFWPQEKASCGPSQVPVKSPTPSPPKSRSQAILGRRIETVSLRPCLWWPQMERISYLWGVLGKHNI